MKNNKKIWLPVIFAIFVVYVLLRFWNLTDACLWFDEIFSIHAAEQDWLNLFWFVAQDLIHPPLFYVLLKLWISVGGDSLFWLRTFPVLFSILALAPFYFLCKQLKLNYSTIALALTFFAVNGALIKYAQEVRMYAPLLFFSLVSVWLFTRFLQLGKNIWILSLVNVLLIYTHYFGWFVVLAEVSAILILQRIKIRQILIMFGICLLSFVPWIYALWRAAEVNADVSQNIGWMSRPNLQILIQFVFDLIEPFYFQASSDQPFSNYKISIPVLLIIIAAKILFLTNYKTLDDIQKRDFWMLVIFIKMPVLLVLLLSWLLPVSIWGSRHLIIVFAPALILIAKFFDLIKERIIKIALLSVLILLFLAAFIIELRRPEQIFIWCAWENLSENLDKNQTAKIYAFEDLNAYHLWFALRRNDNIEIKTVKNIEGISEDTAYFLPRGFNEVKAANDFEGERFFIAFRDTEWNLQKQPLRHLISNGYKIGEPRVFEAQKLKAFLVEVEK